MPLPDNELCYCSDACRCYRICRCCPNVCECELCFDLRRGHGNRCRRLTGSENVPAVAHISQWTKRDKTRTDVRPIPQGSPDPPAATGTDSPLQFHMELDDPPEVPTNMCVQSRIGMAEHSQVTSNINVESTRQSQISGMPNKRNVPRRSSETNPNTDTKRRAKKYIEKPCPCNQIRRVSKTHVSEMTTAQDLHGISQVGPNASVSRHGASYPIETQTVCNPSIPVSERTESRVREMPNPQDLPGCSWYNLDEGISKPEEPQIPGASCTVSPLSNEYCSESLQYSSSSNDYPPSYSSIVSRSPSPLQSTSAPSIYHIPEAVSKSLKQKTLVAQNTVKTSVTPQLSELETQRISDSTDRETTSGLGSSIETRSSDMSNRTRNINGHPDLQSACATSASLSNISVRNAPEQSESVKQSSSQTSTANRPKLPSPELSKADRRRKSSESSIETLSRDPANKTSEDEHTADTSPKKDN